MSWAAVAALGTLGGLGLNWMGMNSATKAQNKANSIYERELARRNSMQAGYMQNELQRLDADKGLQESALEQIKKLMEGQQGEILPIRENFLKDIKPYLDEQKLYLKDPVAWQRKQDDLMLKSPYASKGVEGEGRAYMGAKANPYKPSKFFTDAAQQAWSDAIRGFSDDRMRRQKQGLEAADIDYKNKVSDIGNKYMPKVDYIKDMLGIGLGHSAKIGEAGARGLGYGMDSSREAADIGGRMALGRGEADRAKYTFLGDTLKDLIPERTIEGYSNPQDFLTDKYFAKEIGLEADDKAVLKALRKLSKNKKISLVDIINNEDLFGKKDA
jgi:hypothetical protein